MSVEAQGTVLVAHAHRRRYAPKKYHPPLRGSISTFSNASRRRLIELFSRMNVTRVRVTFLTLTFAGTPSASEATRAFRAFSMRLRRKFPKLSAIWRKELQARGSWHYHLIVMNMPFWAQRLIQQTWEACTGEERSVVHVKLLTSGKQQAMFYVSKYLAKRDKRVGSPSLDNASYLHAEGESGESVGRFWGCINRNELPFDVRRIVVVADEHMYEAVWNEIARLSGGRGATQTRTARLYGTFCYDLVEKVSHNAHKVLYDITHLNSNRRIRYLSLA